MRRQAVRWLVALIAVTVLLEGAVGRQPATPDKIVVRDKKDGSTKTYDGTLKFGTVGLQIVGADMKVLATISPSDIVKFTPGELPGIDRGVVLGLLTSEEKKTK